MVIKSPAASAMRAKESAEAVLSPKQTGSARVVRLGGFGVRNVTNTSGSGVASRMPEAGSNVASRMPASSTVVANRIEKPFAKPVKRSFIKSSAAATASTAQKKPTPPPAVRFYKEEKPKGFDDSKNRKKPKKPEYSESSFYQKLGQAAPTTRIGAKLSALQAEFIPQVSFWKVLAMSVAAGVFGIGYIHHGFQMQEQLNQVESLELQMERTRRVFAEKQIRYDRLTGPKEIYQKAQEAGFVSSGPANQSIPVRIDTP